MLRKHSFSLKPIFNAGTLVALGGLCLSLVAGPGCGTLIGNPESAGGGAGTGSAGSSGTASPGKALTISITDAPVDDAAHVYITIAKLEILGQSWIEVPLTTAERIDVLSLQEGVSATLGALETLAPGSYKQLRLHLDPENPPLIVLADGSEHPLKIPGAEESGIKAQGEFVVEEGKPLKLTLDFDLRKSIKRTGPSLATSNGNENGNGNGNEIGNSSGHGNGNGNGNAQGPTPKFMFKPVVRLVVNDNAGTLLGTGDPGMTACAYKAGDIKDSSSDCDQAVNSVRVKGGTYRIAFLESGTYDVRVFDKQGGYEDFNGLIVTSGKETEIRVAD